MADTTVSSQIYKSRDQIRNQLISLLKQYLELENVDLTKSSFLSFIVEVLSTMSSNLMFYQISSYREFFLTKAQLPESIYNLAAFLGYNPADASAAEANVLYTIPFGFSDPVATFTLPEGYQVKGEGNILFSTYYTTTVTVTGNSQVSVLIREGNRSYNLPITYTASSFLFILPFRQYSISEQEFQISEDLQQYQFVSLDVSFDGQISSQVIEIRPPNSASYETYTEVASLFLMDDTTKGYVSRRTDNGLSLQFGNGLIGYQPEPGSTVKVTLSLTDGIDGNVIAGSISKGDRIYNTTDAGITEIVEYSITNASPAYGGADEESLENVRRNAITNLTALERIVTAEDFANASVIIDDSPIGQNSLPVLKRSDLKVNEIALFSTILFGEDLVPTRDLPGSFASTFVPRQTVITENGISYYTMFDMEIDTLNSSADYTYIMYEIEQIPVLVTNYGTTYDLYADLLEVSRSGLSATYKLNYQTTETDAISTTCQMEISESGATYNMTNDGTAFVLVFADNRVIPKGDLTYFFTIQHPSEGLISQYSNQFIFRLALDDFTMSSVITDSTSLVHTVYDIPTVQKDYYDGVDQRVFETQVLQNLLTTLTFKDYRMLTDFVNFKFANTTGTMTNMQLNDVDLLPATDITSIPPPAAIIGSRYIVLNGTGDWIGHDNELADLVLDGTSSVWSFTVPKSDQMIYVTNKLYKYLYSESGWVVPNYEIPIQISLDVFKSDTYSGTLSNLSQLIKESLITSFTDRFGLNINLYRSEIIDVVQEVVGVKYCRLITPESSIFFNFDIDEFTQQELLEYAPEYIYFTEDDIAIRIY